MERYWFYGTMPNKTIEQKDLTDEQIRIIESETIKMDRDNYSNSWVGMKNGSGWDFMRHGFEVIHIDEEKANIARKKVSLIIEDKYSN